MHPTPRANMEQLPTALTTAQLEELLRQLETLPSAAINRVAPDTVTVTARRRADGQTVTVLSAITADRTQWSVRAAPGLIRATITATN
jgi:hypothetical protein